MPYKGRTTTPKNGNNPTTDLAGLSFRQAGMHACTHPILLLLATLAQSLKEPVALEAAAHLLS